MSKKKILLVTLCLCVFLSFAVTAYASCSITCDLDPIARSSVKVYMSQECSAPGDEIRVQVRLYDSNGNYITSRSFTDSSGSLSISETISHSRLSGGKVKAKFYANSTLVETKSMWIR